MKNIISPQLFNKFVNNISVLLLIYVASILVVPIVLIRDASAETTQKPNVVFIMTDDQTVEDMKWMPKTASLVGGANGVTYKTSWTSLSWCCPSRATLQTGQHAHNTGVYSNELPTGGYGKFQHQTALPVWLQSAGYKTTHIGKALNDTNMNRPNGWNDWRATVQGDHKMYNWKVNDNGIIRTYGTGDANFQGDVYADMAKKVIENSDPDQPFFLNYMMSAPHVGNAKLPEPPRRYKGTANATLPKPPGFAIPAGSTVSSLQLEYQRRAESLKGADDQVEVIMKALENKGVLDNTVVIFYSDNGFLMGEHGFRGKSIYYEEAMAVPLLIRGPGFTPGTTVTAPVQNIDIAPTIAELAGATPLVTVDGISLLGNLDENRGLLFESKRDDPNVPLWSGIRANRFIYVHKYKGGSGILWDMQRDPGQLNNYINDPDYSGILTRLKALQTQKANCVGADCYFVIDNQELEDLYGGPAPVDPDDNGGGVDPVDPGDTTGETKVFPATNTNQTTLTLGSSYRSIDISWDLVSGASKYQLKYRKIGGPTTWVPVINGTAESNHKLVDLEAGNYEVSIRIYKSALWQTWNVGQINLTNTSATTQPEPQDPIVLDEPVETTPPEVTPPIGPETDNVISKLFTSNDTNKTSFSLVLSNDNLLIDWDVLEGANKYQIKYQKNGEPTVWLPVFEGSDVTASTIDNLHAGNYKIEIRVYKSKVWQDWHVGEITIL